ncbi:MAG: hypothetical protein K6D94_11135, partial [Clostridiales bacterium]|nr:hypothetical protein [Clostridiales bacterium]
AVALMLYNFINAEFPAVVKGPVLGGWSKTESPVITEDQKAAFDKAMDGLVGVDYIPVAVLAQQVVSGTNYLFLCRSTVVVPDALEKFSFVTVYADLEGGAEVTDIVSTEIMTRIDPEEDGGWIAAESPDVPRAIAETYDTVSKGTAVEGYSPVACLASDADGQNYCLLCGDDAGYAFAYLHTPAEGDAELTEIFLLQE